MQPIKRRNFLWFLGIGSISLFHTKGFSQNDMTKGKLLVEEIQKILKNKRKMIQRISYSIIRKPIFVKNSDSFGATIMELQIYGDFQKKYIKTVISLPTENSPDKYNGKVTTVLRDHQEFQLLETLDGNSKPEYHERNLDSHEKANLSSYFDDIIPALSDSFIFLEGTEFSEGEHIYKMVQGDTKYWFSQEKEAITRKEIYRNPNRIERAVEYKNLEYIQPVGYLPSLVIDKHFDKEGAMIEEYHREIRDISINPDFSDDWFIIKQEKKKG